MAAPVLRAPADRIFGSGEILGMEEPNRDPLVVIEQFRSGHVARPYLQPLTDLPGRWLARAMSPVAAYNVLVLSSFPLAALAGYLLARHVTGSHLGATVAALAFAFLPFHLTQAAGHPHVAQTQWIPLYFLALWRCADRPGIGPAAWLLAAAAAVTASNFYGGFIAATLSPVALLAYGLAAPREVGRWRRIAITAGVLAVAAAVAIGLIAMFAAEAGALGFPRADLFVWSARWWSYLVPPADHPLWGAAVRGFWAARGVGPNALEHQQVGVPLALVALAAVAVIGWRRRDPALRMVPVLLIVGMAAVVCSLSPERQIGSFLFVRPSALLHELAPMFRAHARFGVVAGLMAALLAGAGASVLWERRARGVVILLLALAAVEVAPFPPWRWRSIAAPQYLGFHPREDDGGRSWRWMGQTGAVRITVPDDGADVVLVAELKAFPTIRRVDWLVDGRRMGSMGVVPEWQRYTLALGRLERGAHTVTLACADPAVVADAVLANGDRRLLALAVGQWAIDSD